MRAGLKTPQNDQSHVGAAVASKQPGEAPPPVEAPPPPPGETETGGLPGVQDWGRDGPSQGVYPLQLVADETAYGREPCLRVGASTTTVAGLLQPTVRRTCDPTQGVARSCQDTCNTAASDAQLCVAVDSYCCTTAVMSEDAAIRGKIDMNSPAVERAGGGVRGIAGTVLPLVGRFNGIVFYFYGKAITIDVYVMKDWHMGSVDMLLGYDTLVKYHGVSDYAKGTTTFHDLKLTIGRGPVQHAAPLQWRRQIMNINATVKAAKEMPADAELAAARDPARVTVTALVGAPHAGKSACLAYIVAALTLLGVTVFVANEGASEVIAEMGSPPFVEGDVAGKAEFQRRVMQRAQRNMTRAVQSAQTHAAAASPHGLAPTTTMVIMDRCPHCCLCFVSDAEGAEMCRRHNVTPMTKAYDLVLILQSTATDDELSFDMAADNALRFHDRAESAAVERQVHKVYGGHHCVRVVPVHGHIEEKARECTAAICTFLGLSQPSEGSARDATAARLSRDPGSDDAVLQLNQAMQEPAPYVDVTQAVASVAHATAYDDFTCAACEDGGSMAVKQRSEWQVEGPPTQWVDCDHGVVQVSGKAGDPYGVTSAAGGVVQQCFNAACCQRAADMYALWSPQCAQARIDAAEKTRTDLLVHATRVRAPGALSILKRRGACGDDGVMTVQGEYLPGSVAEATERHPRAESGSRKAAKQPLTDLYMQQEQATDSLYLTWPTKMTVPERLVHQYARFLARCNEVNGSPFVNMPSRVAQFRHWMSRTIQPSYLQRYTDPATGKAPAWVRQLLDSMRGSVAQNKQWADQARVVFEASVLNHICMEEGNAPPGRRTTPRPGGVTFAEETDDLTCLCDQRTAECVCLKKANVTHVPFKDIVKLDGPAENGEKEAGHSEYPSVVTDGQDRRWMTRLRRLNFLNDGALDALKRRQLQKRDADPLAFRGCTGCGYNESVGQCICSLGAQSDEQRDASAEPGTKPSKSCYGGTQPACAEELRDLLQTATNGGLHGDDALKGIQEQEGSLNRRGLSLYANGGGWRADDRAMMRQQALYLPGEIQRRLLDMGLQGAAGKAREMVVRRRLYRLSEPSATSGNDARTILHERPDAYTTEGFDQALLYAERYARPLGDVSHENEVDENDHKVALAVGASDLTEVLVELKPEWFKADHPGPNMETTTVCKGTAWDDEVKQVGAARQFAFMRVVDHEGSGAHVADIMYHHGGTQQVTVNVEACAAVMPNPNQADAHRRQRQRKQRLRKKLATDDAMRVGGLITKAEGWRKPGCPFTPPSGQPPTCITPEIHQWLNAESERLQVVRNVYLPHADIDMFKRAFANVYTASDLDPKNMMTVDWRPGWEADVPKHGLRPQSPAQLKVIITHIKAFVKAGWLERWRGPNPPVIHPIFCITKPTPEGEEQRYRVLVDAQMGNGLCIPPTGPVDTCEGVIQGIQAVSRESYRQIKANQAGTRKLVATEVPVEPDNNWLDAKGRPHVDRPKNIAKKPGTIPYRGGDLGH